jgi:hypothetical protein
MRVKRYFFTAYHLTHDVVQTINFPRIGGGGGGGAAAASGSAAAVSSDFKIKFFIYAFRPESDSVYCYIEFDDQVVASTMISRLEDLGATCVYPQTFPKTADGAQLALAAVKFITDTGLITRVHFKSGSPTDGSMVQHCIRLEHNGRAPVQSELDEKTARALLESVRGVGSSVASEINKRGDAAELAIHNMQSAVEQRFDEQGNQVAEVVVEMSRVNDAIQTFAKMQATIDALQKEKEELKGKLARQTKLTDQAEQKMGLKTQKINELEQLVNELEDDNQMFREMHASHGAELNAVTVQLEEAKKHVEELRAMQWYVRAVKRQRIATMEDGGADE